MRVRHLGAAAFFILALTTPPVRAADAGYKLEPGPFKTAVEDLVLKDPARSKDLNLKVRFPADEAGPFPLVIFSHGLGGSNGVFGKLTDHWAGHGYVVILPTHWDSQQLLAKQGTDPAAVHNSPDEVMREKPLDRLQDVKFILDNLDQIESKVPALGKGKIDRRRIGMAGHSAGAWTTQLAIGVKFHVPDKGIDFADRGDKRIRAGILISGQGTDKPVFTKESWSDLTTPMLAITGSNDWVKTTGPKSRREPFELAKPGDKYLIFIEGATHGSYAGNPAAKGKGKLTTADVKMIADVTASGTLAFLDAYVKDDPNAKAYLATDALVTMSAGKAAIERK